MFEFKTASLLILCFILGSAPSGYLIGKFYGIDLRKSGSGNIGATNALRTLGKKAGALTFVLDVLKGVVGCFLPIVFISNSETIIPLAGFLTVLGHCFSPFLNFKGGKGVATSFGVFLVVEPFAALVGFVVFAMTFYLSRIVSISSILATLGVFITTIALEKTYLGLSILLNDTITISALLITTIVIARHRENISRLISKEELAFKKC